MDHKQGAGLSCRAEASQPQPALNLPGPKHPGEWGLSSAAGRGVWAASRSFPFPPASPGCRPAPSGAEGLGGCGALAILSHSPASLQPREALVLLVFLSTCGLRNRVIPRICLFSLTSLPMPTLFPLPLYLILGGGSFKKSFKTYRKVIRTV